VVRRYRYDPLFTYYAGQPRGNPDWATGLRQAYADRGAGRLAAPPRTFAQQTVVRPPSGSAPLLATPLASRQNVRLTQVNQTQLVTAKRRRSARSRYRANTDQLEGNVSKGRRCHDEVAAVEPHRRPAANLTRHRHQVAIPLRRGAR